MGGRQELRDPGRLIAAPINMLDPKRPCDCKGAAVDRRRKKRVAKPPTPLNDFEQVRNEALGAADRSSYLMADAMNQNRVRL